MDAYHTTFLGMRELPRDLTSFELQAFFTFAPAELELINERRRPLLKLGLALQIGFLRMTGRSLDTFRVIPTSLWRHLSGALGVRTPDIASLRALYQREQTLFDHQQLACHALGFAWMNEGQRRYLVGVLRDEVTCSADRDRLMVFARRWLYDHHLLILHDRALRKMIVTAVVQFETALAKSIRQSVPSSVWVTGSKRSRPCMLPESVRSTGSGPREHSTRQIAEMFERIEFLSVLGVDQYLVAIPDGTLRRYARRLTSRAPSAGVLIKEPVRTVEVACFLRYCLLAATDQLILMVRRRIADLWRQASVAITDTSDWAQLYRELLKELTELTNAGLVPDADLRKWLAVLVTTSRARKPPTRAQRIRDRLIEAVRPIRALLLALTKLSWQSTGEQPVIEAIARLRELYAGNVRVLPDSRLPALGSAWRDAITGFDRERAFRALEAATLFALRRAIRNGSVWIAHSFSFRSRDQLFLPKPQWDVESRRHYARLALPTTADAFLQPLHAPAPDRSDMMSLETSQRVWRSRVDPRRQTASIGIYTHVRDRWGIFYAQPIVLNERQAGAGRSGSIPA